MIAIKQIPYRCIWCLREPPSATFNSESHVLPKCVGNKWQQVLPPGIVCDRCNHGFGGKVERALIDDPIFFTIAGILQQRDINGKFVYEHSPSGVHRNVHTDTDISDNKVTVNIKYEIQGQPGKPYETREINKSKDYDSRSLALLSRAVHKIAFESLAYSLFVKNSLEIVNIGMKDIDIFSSEFQAIRRWGRDGEPQRSVREVLRFSTFDKVKTQEELFQRGDELWYFQQWFCCKLNLFNDWYIMSLTSPADKVDGDLRSWTARTKFTQPVWMVGDKLEQIIRLSVK